MATKKEVTKVVFLYMNEGAPEKNKVESDPTAGWIKGQEVIVALVRRECGQKRARGEPTISSPMYGRFTRMLLEARARVNTENALVLESFIANVHAELVVHLKADLRDIEVLSKTNLPLAKDRLSNFEAHLRGVQAPIEQDPRDENYTGEVTPSPVFFGEDTLASIQGAWDKLYDTLYITPSSPATLEQMFEDVEDLPSGVDRARLTYLLNAAAYVCPGVNSMFGFSRYDELLRMMGQLAETQPAPRFLEKIAQIVRTIPKAEMEMLLGEAELVARKWKEKTEITEQDEALRIQERPALFTVTRHMQEWRRRNALPEEEMRGFDSRRRQVVNDFGAVYRDKADGKERLGHG